MEVNNNNNNKNNDGNNNNNNINKNNDGNNNNVMRGNRGRQKVEMVKMTNESNLQVTFSKRRAGLFKKASELCTLCGVEIALLVFSPGRKVFSFGHPSVEEIVERYVKSRRLVADQLTVAGDVGGSGTGPGASNGNGEIQLIEAHRNANLRELNAQLAQVIGRLDVERKHGEEMNKLRKASQAQFWWESPVDKLDMEQLGQLKKSMEELKKVVNQQADRIMMQAPTTINATGPSGYTLAPLPPPLQLHPAAGASGSGQQGAEGGGGGNMMMVSYNKNLLNTNLINMNTAGFSTNTGIFHWDPLNNNNNNNNNHNLGPVVNNTYGMMNMAPPLPFPPPPPPQQQQSPQYPHHGYNNNIGYGRGFY